MPPGEVNLIKKGGFYGWPYFYGANVRDTDFGGRYDEKTHGQPIAPAHEFKAHVAPLSLRFMTKQAHTDQVPKGGLALVAQHGSWNRSSKIGYKVVQLAFDDQGTIQQSDFLTGFLHKGKTRGRPVDSLELPNGSVLISDDYNGVIWMMRPKG